METDYDVQKVERKVSLGRAYLAGPMTGIPQFNFPYFDRAASLLRDAGWDIVSPAELDDERTREAALASENGDPGDSSLNGETWADFLARDVKLIADEVDAVILLKGWQRSKGARLEAFVAALSGHKVYRYLPICRIGVEELPEAELHSILHESAVQEDLPNPDTKALVQPDLLAAAERAVEEQFLLGPPAPTVEGEVRTTNETTGGQKGSKRQQLGLLPLAQLLEVSEHYVAGAEKYDAHNWMRGYDWSLSFNAMQRHAVAWWAGHEEYDEETGTSHLSAIVFHALALLYFRDHFPQGDDRPPRNSEEAQS